MSGLNDLLYSKRKIDKIALDYQLRQLKLAEQSDLRMQNSVQQRFSAKYGWFDDIKYNQQIVELLLTNGEIDCEKILYLYALSTHPCGPLMAPCKAHKTLPYLSQESSQFETIHDRAQMFPKRFISLPIFIINLNHNESKSMQDYNLCLKQNNRLATRLFINKPIILLIQTILEALQGSNREKLSCMLTLAKDVSRMEEIIVKPDFLQFLQHLGEQKFVWNSESYDITWPVTECVLLNIDNATNISIKLVRKIRNIVYRQKDKCTANPFDLENQVIKYSMPYNFDNKNSKCTNDRVSEAGEEEKSKMKFNVEKIAVQLNNKAREAYERDMKELRKSLAMNSSSPLPPSSSTAYPDKQTFSATTSRNKSTIREVKKNVKKAAFSQSTEFLTNIIEKECKKMKEFQVMKRKEKGESSGKKTGVTSTSARKASFSTRNTRTQFVQYYARLSACMPVNNQNLDKIKHEISVNENRKRVKKFLNEPLFEQNYREE